MRNVLTYNQIILQYQRLTGNLRYMAATGKSNVSNKHIYISTVRMLHRCIQIKTQWHGITNSYTEACNPHLE